MYLEHRNWQPDNARSTCNNCEKPFTVTRRRHHCRGCGQLFCGSCNSYTVVIAKKTHKSCYSCAERFSSEATASHTAPHATNAADSEREKTRPERDAKDAAKKQSLPAPEKEAHERADEARDEPTAEAQAQSAQAQSTQAQSTQAQSTQAQPVASGKAEPASTAQSHSPPLASSTSLPKSAPNNNNSILALNESRGKKPIQSPQIAAVIWFRFPLYLSSKEAEKIQKKFDSDEEEWKHKRDNKEAADRSATPKEDKSRDAYLATYCQSVAAFYYETGDLANYRAWLKRYWRYVELHEKRSKPFHSPRMSSLITQMSQFPHKAQSEALAKAYCEVAAMYSRLGKAVKGYEFIVNSVKIYDNIDIPSVYAVNARVLAAEMALRLGRFPQAVEHLAAATTLRSCVQGGGESQKPLVGHDALPSQSERGPAKIPSPHVLQRLQELVAFFNQHSKAPNPLSPITSGSAFHFYLDANVALVAGRCVFYTDCPLALQHFQQAESRLQDLEQAIQLCSFDVKFKNLLRKLNDKKLAECYLYLSKYYYALQDYGQAIHYAQESHLAATALTKADEEEKERGSQSPREPSQSVIDVIMHEFTVIIGDITQLVLLIMLNYAQVLLHYDVGKTMKLLQSALPNIAVSDRIYLSQWNGTLAALFYHQKSSPLSIDYFEKALSYFQNEDLALDLSALHHGKGLAQALNAKQLEKNPSSSHASSNTATAVANTNPNTTNSTQSPPTGNGTEARADSTATATLSPAPKDAPPSTTTEATAQPLASPLSIPPPTTQNNSSSPTNSPTRSPRSPREVALFGGIINFKQPASEEAAAKQQAGVALVESSHVTQEYARALDSLARALELAQRVLPNNHFHLAAIRIDMGQIFYRRGNFMKALELFNESLLAFGNDEQIHYRLQIRCYYLMGKTHLRLAEIDIAVIFFDLAVQKARLLAFDVHDCHLLGRLIKKLLDQDDADIEVHNMDKIEMLKLLNDHHISAERVRKHSKSIKIFSESDIHFRPKELKKFTFKEVES